MGQTSREQPFYLLKTIRFLPLFISQFLGAFNDNIFKNALVILITYRLSTSLAVNASILVTSAAGIFILPFFLFSATAGQLADKYDKSRLISIIKFIEIILVAIAAFGFYTHKIPLLMVLLFALGAHSTFFGPLKYSILPSQLHRSELIAGNGLIEAGTFLAILLGTILGGSLILQPYGEIIISALLITAAVMGWISSWYIPKTSSYAPHLKIRFNIFKETLNLIHYAQEKWDVFLTILGISWFWFVGAIFLAEFPGFTKDILHAHQSVVTLFLTLFSVGLAVGSLLCNKLLKGQVNATYVPLGALGITLFMLDLYVAGSHFPPSLSSPLITLLEFLKTSTGIRISIDLLLIAISGGIYSVPLYALLQIRSERKYLARIIASNNIMNAFFMFIAASITILLLKIGITILQIFLLLAISNGLVAIYICRLLPETFIKGFFRWLLTFLFRVEVKGLENYRQAGNRVVIIANHTSFLDAVLLASFLPHKFIYAINSMTAKKWWVQVFLQLVDAYPMNPTNPMAIKSLINLVKENRRCVIFPEGRITVTGALMKIYEGPGLVADKSRAKILPICIQGAQLTFFSRLRGKTRRRFMPKIRLTIFPPQTIDLPLDLKGRRRRQKIGYDLYNLMKEILFKSSDPQQTLFSTLLDAATKEGSRYPIVEDIARQPLSYKQFITRCFILGNLISKKSQMGESVGILLPTLTSTAVLFFALSAFSRIPAMLNYSIGIKNLFSTCELAHIKTIYTSRHFVEVAKINTMIVALEKAGYCIIYLEDLRLKVNLFVKIKSLLQASFPRFTYKIIHRHLEAKPFLNANSTAVILFTSGSEGSPKGVVLSHANLQANRLQLSACVDFNMTDKVFNALPVFHAFGLTAGLLLPLLSGVKTFFYPSPLHYRIVPELTYDTNATILFGTDTFLAGYARCAHPYDFYSIRYVFAGAEKLREETQLLWLSKFGVRVFEGYGATEASPAIAMNTPMQNKLGTVGQILPGIQYKLIPVPGIESGGILEIKGPNVMKGYLVAGAKEMIPPPDKWFETGDVVTIDEMGFMTITGRVKRFAKIAGEMVSLQLVEKQIYQLWPNSQHAVISVPDASKGEQLVLATTFVDATREHLVRLAKQHQFTSITLPRKIMIFKNLPLLVTGKVDYVSLKEWINANHHNP